MDRTQLLFLDILNAAIHGHSPENMENVTAEEWSGILSLAQMHSVLPLVYNTAYGCPGFPADDALRGRVRQLVMMQTLKTSEFGRLYSELRTAGCTPLVVKGIVCRSLYPVGDLRLSTDEDLLVSPAQLEKCIEIMAENELYTDLPADKVATEYEIPFRKKDGALYIELHKQLFRPQSDAYGHWNEFFTDVWTNAVECDGVMTLSYTDHLLYLLCHAFKHFLHSGFGIRQLCDIVLYANKWGHQVDWGMVHSCCRKIRAECFAATLFAIGEKYLGFAPVLAAYPAVFAAEAEDETDILADLLSAGVFGTSSMSRRHSSNITLDAAAGRGTAGLTLKSTLFPSARSLQGRYPYLKDRPYLLPGAWASRLISYLAETRKTKDSSVADSLRIGGQRVELLKKYRVIR